MGLWKVALHKKEHDMKPYQESFGKTMSLCIKRGIDLIFSVPLLVIAFPLICVAVIGIIFTMPGSILFKQERVGLNGKPFNILKLRTMKVDKEIEQKRDMTRDEERKTVWGNWLRRFKIDELMQLVNVIKGDMSLVGPRPTVIEQVEKYTARERHRLDMRPGMTGLAQVNGNVALTWEERIAYDLQYIENYSLLLDVAIMVKTIKVVAMGEEKYLCKPNRENTGEELS